MPDNCSKGNRFNLLNKLSHAVKIRVTGHIYKFRLEHGPINRKKIVFSNFNGNCYGDNPKYICDEILRRGSKYDLVWILKKGRSAPEGVRVVEFGSDEAWLEMATAKMWIWNIRNFPHPPKKKNQVYLQTWHGGGVVLKELEGMAPEKLSPRYVADAKLDGEITDYILSSDAIRTEVERKYFWLNPKAVILEYGTPRDDIFFDEEQQKQCRETVFERYAINSGTKIILYMPTFRDDGNTDCYDLDYLSVIKAFEARFKAPFVLFVRFHPNVPQGAVSVPSESNIIDVTSYPEAYDLFCVADFAISDYNSSAICKMPLLKKPSFIFASDYSDYRKKRGLTKYYDELPIPIATTNEQLIWNIASFDEKSYFDSWDRFYSMHPSYENGTATEKIVDVILNEL